MIKSKNRLFSGITLLLLLTGMLTSTFNFTNTGANKTKNLQPVGSTDFSVTQAFDWWPMFHHDLNHTGYSTSTAPNTNNTIWSHLTGDGVFSSPAVANGQVYVGSCDDKIYCLNASTGDHIWSYTTGDDVDSSPALADGKVYVGSRDDKIYCFGLSAGAPDIAVTNLTSCYGSTVLAQNRTYTVDMKVTNEGDTSEKFELSIFWNTTKLINSTTVMLGLGETKNVILDWNTTGCPRYANYTLSAYAAPLPGETDVLDNTFVDSRILMMTHPGDIDNNKKVDIKDIAAIAILFGAIWPDPPYDSNKDITCDGKIDIKDIATAARNFGYIEP